ncbi:hypothetical protein FB451DRAFT_1562509 [Mycena latifolia]|nr:hypothetical protein FB451DRAFT_1562509 [Mycena latifolia]
MPTIYVPDDVAASFLAVMDAEGASFPPALRDLRSLFPTSDAPPPGSAPSRAAPLRAVPSQAPILARDYVPTRQAQPEHQRRVAPLPRRARSVPLGDFAS